MQERYMQARQSPEDRTVFSWSEYKPGKDTSRRNFSRVATGLVGYCVFLLLILKLLCLWPFIRSQRIMKYLFILLLSMPGVPVQWKKADDQIVGRIQKAQLAKMRITVDALHSFLQDSCFAESGLSPVWRGAYSAEPGAKVSFGIECQFSTSGGLGR